ncbi:MAG TPA: hypothetical protein VF258_00160, partial [Luteolibacter sp.]
WGLSVGRGGSSATKARVSIRAAKWKQNNVQQNLIQVDCQGGTLKFGSPIPDEAKAFIAEAMRRTIAES